MSVSKMKKLSVLFLGVCLSIILFQPAEGSNNSVQWADQVLRMKVGQISKVEPYGEKGIKVSFSPTDWLLFTTGEIRNGKYESAVEFYQLRQRPWEGNVWLSFDGTNKQLIAKTAINAWQMRYSNYQLLSKDPREATTLLVNRLTNYYKVEKHRGKTLANALIDEGLGAGIIQMKTGS